MEWATGFECVTCSQYEWWSRSPSKTLLNQPPRATLCGVGHARGRRASRVPGNGGAPGSSGAGGDVPMRAQRPSPTATLRRTLGITST
mmetsp:Transcript_27681/g.80948  ORF Transcript_27681/g.80948 Transcript_27681/m.80948 type:complete len:88 (-) Transcript_27681:155-418(-)